nr:hypothetical protein [uncultured Arsenicibacter sp.]
MNKLTQLRVRLNGRIYYASDHYLAFVDRNGQPCTVTVDRESDRETLVVSGNTPNQKMYRTGSVEECAMHVTDL